MKSRHLSAENASCLKVRDLVTEYCGISVDDWTWSLLEVRLRPYWTSLHLESFDEISRHLKAGWEDPNLWEPILDRILAYETYFFREMGQLSIFESQIVPEILRDLGKEGMERGGVGRGMRLWSAACSSGEEPYTMSIILLESGIPERVPVTIYATDINPRLLNAAQRGVYSEEAVASLPTRFVEKYFARHEDGYHLNEKVKGMVQFGTLNLYQETWPDYLAELDVILCRNVVMYLTKPAREKVVERLHRCMSPNGFLMLGHAESLPKISTSLISRNISKETVYQKSFIENIGGP